MAHLWWRDSKGCWQPFFLDAPAYALRNTAETPLDPLSIQTSDLPDAMLIGTPPSGRTEWILLTSSNPTVARNGLVPPAGIVLLADRDELHCLDGGRYYFSSEELPQIESFPGVPAEATVCPRCKSPLEQGRPAVLCPQCRIWHHQDAERGLECWTYSERCAFCPQSTALDGAFRWTPEEL